MGYFWEGLSEFAKIEASWPGHAARTDSRYVIRLIKKPAEELRFPNEMNEPEAVFGITENGGMVAWEVVRSSENGTLGGSVVSVREFLGGRDRAGRVNPRDLASGKVSSISARFFGLGTWSGLAGGTSDREYHANGTLKNFGYRTKSIPEMRTSLDRRTSIGLGVTWRSTERQLDQLTILTPHEFSVSRDKPTEFSDLASEVRRFQDLVSLAYNAFVPSVGGVVCADFKDGVDLSKADLWSGVLMETRPGVRCYSDKTSHPAFTLAAIGGIEGVRRWLRLAKSHPRATGPLTTSRRFGFAVVEVELMNIAVAIDYWVSYCKKESSPRPQWTARGKNHAESLAMHVGREFREFVGGDEKAWARLFWDRYAAIKHDPTIQYDVSELSVLMRGGRVLLMCALLNRVARTKVPSAWICQSTEFHRVGEVTREMLASGPKRYGP